MFKTTLKKRAATAAVGAAAVGMAVGSSLIGGTAAGADPKQYTAKIGVGSDTIQDVMDGLAGFANGVSYTPIQSTSASGLTQVSSWDAVGTPCITPKAPGATFNRPNGSGSGINALSRAIDGANFGDAACVAKPISGLVDFVRSSSGPTAGDTGTALTYVPFARDGVSFAYYANGVATPVTSLTRAQLTAIYTGPATGTLVGSVNIIPCGIQLGSGTYKFWNTVTTASATQEAAATANCTAAGNGNRVEENDASALKAKGDAQVGNEVIVGFSAAQFIAQTNGKSVSHLAAGVDLGSITDNGSGTNLGKPYSGTSAPLSPVAAFYSDTVFGRKVYTVLDSAKVTGFGNNDLKSLFVGAGSVLCGGGAQGTVNLFGFTSDASNCGSTTITGSLGTGTV